MSTIKYLVGMPGDWQTYSTPPIPADTAERWWYWRITRRFEAKRGVLESYRSLYNGVLVQAREITPEDAQRIADLDEEIAALRSRLEVRMHERNEVCELAAARGKKVKVPRE